MFRRHIHEAYDLDLESYRYPSPSIPQAAHIQEIHQDETTSQSEQSWEEAGLHDSPGTVSQEFDRRVPIQTTQYHHLDETSVISPARFRQWTSPTYFATSQLSYGPRSESGSPQSDSLIDHPSADFDRYFDFEAASAESEQEVGNVRKRRVEDLDDSLEEPLEDDMAAEEEEARADKRIRLRSPSPPVSTPQHSELSDHRYIKDGQDVNEEGFKPQAQNSRKRSHNDVSFFSSDVVADKLTEVERK